MARRTVDIHVLGAPAVVVDGDERTVTRPRQQAVLVRLALAAPSAVPVDVLIDDVWGSAPPPSAVDALRVHVSGLRKLVAGADAELIVTRPGAYALAVDAEAVDAHRLEAAVRARDAPVLRSMLDRWREHDLGRLDAGTGWFTAAAERVRDLRAAGLEAIADVEMAAGHHDGAAGALEALVRLDPYRERAWELLVRSLAGAGRRTDALRAGQRAREALGEVGMEPGPGLATAEQSVFDAGAGRRLDGSPGEYVDVEGSSVAFRTLGGHGPDLLFMHGGFVPFEVMPDEPRFADLLGELASRHRVVLLDRRGIGMSEPPADGSAPSIEHWVADCRAVLDAVGSTRCLVYAHENAGPVAVRLAAEEPDRIAGLVLHSTAAKPLRSDDHPYGPTEEVIGRISRMIDRMPGADDVLTLVAPSVGDDPGLRTWLERAGRLGADPARARQLHRTYFDADVRGALADVRAPTIVLQPARRILGDPGQGRFLADRIPDAELRMLDSADHLPFLADAPAVLAAIRDVAERAAGAAPEPQAVLRALVGVAPPPPADLFDGHPVEARLDVDEAVVAVFAAKGAAERWASSVQARTGGCTVVAVEDTTATGDDPAVVAVAARAREAAARR